VLKLKIQIVYLNHQ